MKSINVVAGVILFDQKFLCVQRGVGKFDYISKKFEFPGGKIEVDESPEEALVREIQEELEKEISISQKLMVVDHTYPDFRLIMHAYLCSTKDEHLKLTEHIDFKWLPVSELNSLDWAAADVPIVQKLIELNANNQLSPG